MVYINNSREKPAFKDGDHRKYVYEGLQPLIKSVRESIEATNVNDVDWQKAAISLVDDLETRNRQRFISILKSKTTNVAQQSQMLAAHCLNLKLMYNVVLKTMAQLGSTKTPYKGKSVTAYLSLNVPHKQLARETVESMLTTSTAELLKHKASNLMPFGKEKKADGFTPLSKNVPKDDSASEISANMSSGQSFTESEAEKMPLLGRASPGQKSFLSSLVKAPMEIAKAFLSKKISLDEKATNLKWFILGRTFLLELIKRYGERLPRYHRMSRNKFSRILRIRKDAEYIGNLSIRAEKVDEIIKIHDESQDILVEIAGEKTL